MMEAMPSEASPGPYYGQYLLGIPSGKTLVVSGAFRQPEDLVCRCVEAAAAAEAAATATAAAGSRLSSLSDLSSPDRRRQVLRNAYLTYEGRPLTQLTFPRLSPRVEAAENLVDNRATATPSLLSSPSPPSFPPTLTLRCRVVGGIDRQNRVGSKFGGGGVSSSAQSERERKERLRRLALESIDLARDPYLIRNHLGSYECRLCLTLHRDEANYLAHTQGKKHQQGLAHRAHLEKLQQQKDGVAGTSTVSSAADAASARASASATAHRVRIGRPAYQVFKSRDPDTNQRCLTFEVHYPEISENVQPRHRFMSAFEQRVESPPDRRYQYLLIAADPYDTVAFKIPNEPIDKGEDRFVTHWGPDTKKFTVSLYFVEPGGS